MTRIPSVINLVYTQYRDSSQLYLLMKVWVDSMTSWRRTRVYRWYHTIIHNTQHSTHITHNTQNTVHICIHPMVKYGKTPVTVSHPVSRFPPQPIIACNQELMGCPGDRKLATHRWNSGVHSISLIYRKKLHTPLHHPSNLCREGLIFRREGVNYLHSWD